MGDFDGSAVVTGVGTGVDRAVARRLASGGVAVVLVGRRRNKLDEVAAQIRDGGGWAKVVRIMSLRSTRSEG
jgi:NADP-dependent 3-hydroxy acid dehydrogenase YdfG